MAECVILIGLPAAGKSSFYREHFSHTHDHVSKDLMRHNRFLSTIGAAVGCKNTQGAPLDNFGDSSLPTGLVVAMLA